jgi:hypothetical protein
MISYDENTDQYTLTIRAGNYVLPPGVRLQFKLDTTGYFLSYIEDGVLKTIHLLDHEYLAVSTEYSEL